MADHALAPRPGFDWTMVSWGGPDEPVSDRCGYCGDDIPEDSVPLILGNDAGWCARFCDHCQAAWWGVETFDDPPGEWDEWVKPAVPPLVGADCRHAYACYWPRCACGAGKGKQP